MKPQIIDNGTLNPVIIISREQVMQWIRKVCDDAGYADRELSWVQLSVEHEFAFGTSYHHECPKLLAMVSNIPNSRVGAKG